MDGGAFIMHRCHGISTDITPDAKRAVTKMKATITQRFVLEGGVEVDAESDCRFCFFWEKCEEEIGEVGQVGRVEVGEWRAKGVRHWYEKVSGATSSESCARGGGTDVCG